MEWLSVSVGFAIGFTIGIIVIAIINAGGDDPAPPKKRETCRERLAREHPERIRADACGGCEGCPEDYGYTAHPFYCEAIEDCPDLVAERVCAGCWDRPVEVE